MSKLDGNERWKSKMLLTEHVEQYEQQQTSAKGSIITVQERALIRDYILLPYMEKMIHKSMGDIENTTNVLKRLYLMAGQSILNLVVQDKYRIRRELNRRNIKILTEEQEDLVIYHRYYCRGYEERFGITREVMRSEISLRMAKYMSELGMLLKGRPVEKN